MKKLLIVHGEMMREGGVEMLAAWMIEGLKKNYDLTLLTLSSIDLDRLNHLYGTSLSCHDFKIKRINIPLPKQRFTLLKQHLLSRYVKSLKSEFPLIISTYGEMDFGKKGIQYIHSPGIDGYIDKTSEMSIKKWIYKETFFRKHYRDLCFLISNYSQKRMKENLSLVSSYWMHQRIKEIFGMESTVLYPPIFSTYWRIPWEERENGFLCISRISPEKNIREIINILKKVRENISTNIHLHIIGGVTDKKYSKEIWPLIKNNSNWVFYEGSISRKKLLHLMNHHKYGIHSTKDEHFGSSVAERIKAGCITFVPNNGGQVEIINNDQLLLYDSEEEAVRKIVNVLRNKELQFLLQRKLLLHANQFSPKNFIDKIKQIIEFFQE